MKGRELIDLGAFKDLRGKTVGYLLVLEPADDRVDKNGRHRKCWRCLCQFCGRETIVTADSLSARQQVSCGCYQRKRSSECNKTHGMTDTRLYYVWCGIKNRCYCKSTYEYKWYGDRGIGMCDDWHYDFLKFREWAIANGYDDNAPRGQCTIERIDRDGNYEPGNCKIATMLEQSQNRKDNHYLEYNGEKHTIAEWSRITGIRQEKIRNRVSRLGWTPERALTTK